MQITSHYKVNNGYIVRLYGITQDPETKNYIMVLDYAKNGSLRNYLNINTLSCMIRLEIYGILQVDYLQFMKRVTSIS